MMAKKEKRGRKPNQWYIDHDKPIPGWTMQTYLLKGVPMPSCMGEVEKEPARAEPPMVLMPASAVTAIVHGQSVIASGVSALHDDITAMREDIQQARTVPRSSGVSEATAAALLPMIERLVPGIDRVNANLLGVERQAAKLHADLTKPR